MTSIIRNKESWILRISYSSLLVLPIWLLIWVLMGGNSENPDIKNYIYDYSVLTKEWIRNGEVGYQRLKILAHSVGFSYQYFRLFLYALGLIFLRKGLKQFNTDRPMVYLCYAIALMIIDTTQTYNFVGMSLLVLATSYLTSDSAFSRIKFAICVLLATTFHKAFLFYLPIVFFYNQKLDNRRIKRYFYIFFIFFIISLLPVSDFMGRYLTQLLSVLKLTEYSSYLESRTRWGHLYPIVLHIISTIFVYVLYKLSIIRELKSQQFLRLILIIYLYAFLAFPLFRFQLSLARLTRNLQVLSFVAGIRYVFERRNLNSTIIVYGFLLVIAALMGYFNVYSDYMDTIVRPFIEKNWIL